MGKIDNIDKLNQVLMNGFEKKYQIIQPIIICDHDENIDFTDILTTLTDKFNVTTIDEKENANELEEAEEDKEDEEENINNMTIILESFQAIEETNNQTLSQIEFSSNLIIKDYKTFVIEKKPTIRSSEMLKFPQITICYYINYKTFFENKKLYYSILSCQTEIEVPINQISYSTKNVKPSKKAVIQNERKIENILTRASVLLFKTQLTIQKKKYSSFNSISFSNISCKIKRKKEKSK